VLQTVTNVTMEECDDEDAGLGGLGDGGSDGSGSVNEDTWNGEFTRLQEDLHDRMSDWRRSRPERIMGVIGFLFDNAMKDSDKPRNSFATVYNSWTATNDTTDMGYTGEDAECEFALMSTLDYVMLCYKDNKDNKDAIIYCNNHAAFRENIIQLIYNKATAHGRKYGPPRYAAHMARLLEEERLSNEIEAQFAAKEALRAAEELRLAEQAAAKAAQHVEAARRAEAAVAEKARLFREAEAARHETERKATRSKAENDAKKDRKVKFKAGGGRANGGFAAVAACVSAASAEAATSGGGRVDVAGGGSGSGAAGARVEMAASSSNSNSSASAGGAQIALDGGVGETKKKNLTTNKNTEVSSKSVDKAGEHDVHSSRGAAGGHGPSGGSPGKAPDKAHKTVDKTGKDNGNGGAFVSSPAVRA